MWTLFILFVVVMFLISFVFKQIILTAPFIGFFCFYFYEVNDFIKNSSSLGILNINLMEIITLLIDPLNKIHPLILYTSGGFFLLSFLTLFQYFSINLINFFFIQRSFNLLKLEIKNNLIITSIALMLGSWWAFQEGTWGGWWGWDPSEVLGLLLILAALLYFHSTFKVFFYKQVLIFLYPLFILSINYYFIQLNFELVSHNFGIFYHYFFSSNLFFFENIFFCFMYSYSLLLYLNKIKSMFINFFNIKYHYTNKLFIFIYINSLCYLFIIFCYSFNFIINYFFWTYLKALPTSSILIFNQSNSLFYIVYFILLNNFSYYYLFYFILLNYTLYNFFVLVLLFYRFKINLLQGLHFLLIIFFVLSKFSNNLFLDIYAFKPITQDFLFHLNFNTILCSGFNLNGWDFNNLNYSINTQFRINTLYEIFILNFPKLQYLFQFLSNCSNLSSTLQIFLAIYNHSLFVLNSYLLILFFCFIVFSVLFLIFNIKTYLKSKYLF